MDILGISNFGLVLVAVLLLYATPAPDTAYIVGRSIGQGRSAGLMSAFGISAGCCVHALASAIGLSAILAGTLARRAGRNPHVKLCLQRMVGATFVALGAKLAFTKA